MIAEIDPGRRWLVTTSCHDCFVDVESAGSDESSKWLLLSLVSAHSIEWRNTFKARLSRAWQALHGGADTWMELLSMEEVDDVIEALIRARNQAFPPPAASNGHA